jgi:hypothetical protein
MVAIAGCGSLSAAGSPDHAVAELTSSGHALSADLDAGRYERACKALTQKERGVLAREMAVLRTRLEGAGEPQTLARETVRLADAQPKGCAGFLAFARTLAHLSAPKASLGAEFKRRLAHLVPPIRIKGDIATYRGAVEARYEDEHWRFEGRDGQPPFEVPSIVSNGTRFFPPQ